MERKKFFELILKFLNGQLGKTVYFCGDSVSVADVAYYSEVSTVLMMLEADIDGGLVGGASLDPDEFVSVCRYRLHA